MKKPACASKQDVLGLATLWYLNCDKGLVINLDLSGQAKNPPCEM